MTGDGGNDYAFVTRVPDRDEWPALLASNQAKPEFTPKGWRPTDIPTLRRRMIAAAEDFVAELRRLALECGIALPAPNCSRAHHDGVDAPLILTGHQPIVFHPGLIFKYQATEQFARNQQALAMSILMDTDPGDAGQLTVPSPADLQDINRGWTVAGTRTVSLSSPAALLAGQRMLPAHELVDRSRQLNSDLRACQLFESAAIADGVVTDYRKLAEYPTVHANSIVRRAHGLAVDLLELPLSTLCRQPELQRFFHEIILDHVNFHERYNQSLDAWRMQRRLRNPANPFPNLERQGPLLELPLWWVNMRSCTRYPVWAQAVQSGVQLAVDNRIMLQLASDDRGVSQPAIDDGLLVPRGALITIVFRLLCSELFVHGLGGQTYDQFTDTLIRDYFGIDPPAFAVASASRYLFAEQRARLSQLDELAAHQREMAHHPDDYLGQGWFSIQLEEQLIPLLAEKQQWIATLQAKQAAGLSAADAGRHLHTLQNRIKALVAADFAPRLADRSRRTDGARAAIESRTYPWFFFSWPTARNVPRD